MKRRPTAPLLFFRPQVLRTQKMYPKAEEDKDFERN